MALFSRGKRNRDQSADDAVERSPEAAGPAQAAAEPAASEQAAADPAAAAPAAATSADAAASEATDVTDAAAQASVGISVSSFRGVGAVHTDEPAAAAAAAATDEPSATAPTGQLRMGRETAPPARESVPGLRDNVLLAESLALLPD